MIKAQKHSKDIVKIVHLTSVVQQEFYKAIREYYLCKKTQSMTLLINLSPPCHPIHSDHSVKNVNSVNSDTE